MTAERAKEIGVRALLNKPVVFRELAEKVRQILDESRELVKERG